MTFPSLKEFSVRNLKYMKSFYIEHKEDNEFAYLVAQLPWKHNNLKRVMKQNSDLTNDMMKEPYVFDLVSLIKDYKEKN